MNKVLSPELEARLKRSDFILLVDRSTSMNEAVKAGSSVTRWAAAEEATVGIAQWCTKYDNDGITVGLFASNYKEYSNVDGGVELVKKIFTEQGPNGGTDTAAALRQVFGNYFAAKTANKAAAKPLVLFVVTDGEPDSMDDLMKVITEAVNKVDSQDEIRINFVQVGDSQKAKASLQRLDTGLNLKYDIVNCKTMEDLSSYPTLADAALAMIQDEATV